MQIRHLIKRNLLYYRKRNFFLALGIAVSTAVLTGALIVGDSVEYSLKRIVEHRLGSLTHVMKTGDRYVTSTLAERIESLSELTASPVLILDAIATSGGGQRRINTSQVIGIDERFGETAGFRDVYRDLSGEDVIISGNLARRLDVTEGDEILLRITRASLVPLNAPFVSDADNIVSLRVRVKRVVGANELGSFNLRISQTAPFNVFISLQTLNSIMDLESYANALLFSGSEQLQERDIQAGLTNSIRSSPSTRAS